MYSGTPELTLLMIAGGAEGGLNRGVLKGLKAHAVKLYHPIGVNLSITS
jgi:hypothetical protein